MRPRRAFTALAAASALVLAACGGGAARSASPQVLLQKAKAVADRASAVHFELSSSNLPTSGTRLVGGEGDLQRPASMRGSFEVATGGFTATVKVVSVGGVFEVELPFASHYEKTNPASFGLTDPAQLLSPTNGLTRLLALARDPRLGPRQRVAGELVDTVDFTVPGRDIPVLPDADPARPVDITAAIDPSNYQLRTVTLVGPLESATVETTYVLTLSGYDEHVHITLPS